MEKEDTLRRWLWHHPEPGPQERRAAAIAAASRTTNGELGELLTILGLTDDEGRPTW